MTLVHCWPIGPVRKRLISPVVGSAGRAADFHFRQGGDAAVMCIGHDCPKPVGLPHLHALIGTRVGPGTGRHVAKHRVAPGPRNLNQVAFRHDNRVVLVDRHDAKAELGAERGCPRHVFLGGDRTRPPIRKPRPCTLASIAWQMLIGLRDCAVARVLNEKRSRRPKHLPLVAEG